MRLWLQILALAIAVAGCFSPDPPEGAACSETGSCPPDQQCVGGVCLSAGGTIDASVTDGAPPNDISDPGPTDGGTPDALPGMDGGVPDSGLMDGGPGPIDGGPVTTDDGAPS